MQRVHGPMLTTVCLCSALLYFQSPSTSLGSENPKILKKWDRRFGGSQEDYLRCALVKSDGSFLLGGSSLSGGRGQTDFYVTSVDARGRSQWESYFGGSKADDLFSIIETASGDLLLVGFSASGLEGDKSQTCRGDSDMWVILMGPDGTKKWDRRFGGSLSDGANAAIQLPNGDFLIGGFSNSPADGDKTEAARPIPAGGTGSQDFWLVRIDTNGNKIADQRIGGRGYDTLQFMWQSPTGEIFLAGNSDSSIEFDKTSPPKGLNDFWLVKLDDSLNIVWDKTYGGDKADYLSCMIPLSDGGFLMGGTSYSGATGDKTEPLTGVTDCWILRLDHDGNKIWDRTFGGTGGENGVGVVEMPYGGYMIKCNSQSGISGQKTEPNLGGNDYWVLSVATNGQLLCEKTYGGNATDEGGGVCFLSGGCAVVGGNSFSSANGDVTQPTHGGHDFWIVKCGMDSDGDWSTDGEELIADTDPHDPASYLGFTGITLVTNSCVMSWQGGTNASQVVEYSDTPLSEDATWTAVYSNRPPTPVVNSTAVPIPPASVLFYRIQAMK